MCVHTREVLEIAESSKAYQSDYSWKNLAFTLVSRDLVLYSAFVFKFEFAMLSGD